MKTGVSNEVSFYHINNKLIHVGNIQSAFKLSGPSDWYSGQAFEPRPLKRSPGHLPLRHCTSHKK